MVDRNSTIVSVIVPVYNAERFIEQCVRSISSQGHAGLDIICVNDGSSDRSPEILENLAMSDPRITIVHQSNRGVSAARNAGLMLARGEFVIFVDADDWLHTEMVASYLDAMSNGVDLVMFSPYGVKEFGPAEKDALLYQGIRHTILNSPWAKMYRSDVIRRYGLGFNTDVSLGEDLLFNVEYAVRCSRIRTVSTRKYNVRETPGSLTRSFRPQKYSELMLVHSRLRETVNNRYSNLDFISLLNYLKIKALISTCNSIHEAGADSVAYLVQVRKFESENGSLPVVGGDLQMRAIGYIYRFGGLSKASQVVRIGKSLVAFRGRLVGGQLE